MTSGNKTRERILEAVEPYMHHHEIFSLTVREICSIASVSTSPFYNCFENLDGFIAAVQERLNSDFGDKMSDLIKGNTPSERLLSFGHFYASLNTKDGVEYVARVLKNNISTNHSLVGSSIEPFITANIKEGQANGTFSLNHSVSEITQLIYIALRGCCYEWCKCGGEMDLDAAITNFLKIILHSISNPF